MRVRILLAYLFLTLLVWGLLAFDRGLWLDEAAILAEVSALGGGLAARLVHPVVSPSRLFLGTPYTLALASGRPLLFLQAAGLLAWLAVGVAAHLLARRLFPRVRALPFLAGALTLTASSDLLTASLLAIGYDLSAAAFLLALLLLLRFQDGARPAELAGACLLLAFSLFTTDAAAPAALLAPGLLVLLADRPLRRRTAVAAAAFWGAMVPYVWVVLRTLGDPSQYVPSAFLPLPAAVKALRIAKLFLYNFTPFVWAFARRTWFPAPPPVLPVALRVALGLSAVLSCAWVLRGLSREGGAPSPGRVRFTMVGACLVLTLASNAPFALVRFADVCFRTHLMPRVFASIAVAAAACAAAERWPRLRAAAFAVPMLFVGLGVVGGLERQDVFFGTTQRHRAELRSILAAAPGLAPDAGLVLHVPRGAAALRATHVPYLAEAWFALLYGRFDGRVALWDDAGGSGCRAEAEAFVCPGAAPNVTRTFRYDRVVVLRYEEETGRYLLEREIPASFGAGPLAARYRPEACVVPREVPPLARELLFRETPLTRFLTR